MGIAIGGRAAQGIAVGGVSAQGAAKGGQVVWRRSDTPPEGRVLCSTAAAIDTGIVGGDDVVWECRFTTMNTRYSAAKSNRAICGVRTTVNPPVFQQAAFTMGAEGLDRVRIDWAGAGATVDAFAPPGEMHTIRQEGPRQYFDGRLVQTLGTNGPNTGSLTHWLFDVNSNGAASFQSPLAIAYWKAWRAGQLIADFRPVAAGERYLGGTATVAGMYDVVGRRLYGPRAGGSFTVRAEPDKALPDTGSTWALSLAGTSIDLDALTPSNLLKVEARLVSQNAAGVQRALLGSTQPSPNRLFQLRDIGGYYRYDYGSTFGTATTQAVSKTKAAPDVVVCDANVLTVNGATVVTHPVSTWSNTRPLVLGAVNSDGTVGDSSAMLVWYLKAWQGGVLVRDCIPVKKGDVKAGWTAPADGLWDRASEMFYTGTYGTIQAVDP